MDRGLLSTPGAVSDLKDDMKRPLASASYLKPPAIRDGALKEDFTLAARLLYIKTTRAASLQCTQAMALRHGLCASSGEGCLRTATERERRVEAVRLEPIFRHLEP